MSEHSEPYTTKTESNMFAIGGLVIMLCLFAPILVVIGIAKALTLFTGGDSSTK
jgi:hypothetical protein